MKSAQLKQNIEVTPEASPEQEAAAAASINAKRAELDWAVESMVEAHEQAVCRTDQVKAEGARIIHAIAAADAAVGDLNKQLSLAEADGITETLKGLECGEVALAGLLSADGIRAQQRALILFSRTLRDDRLPLCEERLMEAQANELLAQSAYTVALADRRQLETELHLAAIASEEGDAVLDESKTRTGILRDVAAQQLLQAGRITEQLLARREARAANEGRRWLQSLKHL